MIINFNNGSMRTTNDSYGGTLGDCAAQVIAGVSNGTLTTTTVATASAGVVTVASGMKHADNQIKLVIGLTTKSKGT